MRKPLNLLLGIMLGGKGPFASTPNPPNISFIILFLSMAKLRAYLTSLSLEK